MPWALRMLLLVALIALPIYLYVGFRSASSLSSVSGIPRRRARRIVLAVIGWLLVLPVLTLAFYFSGAGRSLLNLETEVGVFDYLFHYPLWIGIIAMLELLPLFVLLDIVSLATRLRPSVRPAVLVPLAQIRLGLVLIFALYVPIRVAIDTFDVRDTRLDVRVPGLPAELAGLRLTLVGDVQVDRYTTAGKLRQVRDILDRFAPELAFSAGDIITRGTEFTEKAGQAMCPPPASIGNIAVMGDHDFWSDPDRVRALQSACGWSFLENEHRLLDVRGRTLLVTGLTHIYSRRLPGDSIDAFLDKAPEAELKILISHQPAEIAVHAAAAHGYHLFLAGHTHGGQIVFQPFGIPVTPSRWETEYFRGVTRLGTMLVIVTNGVGLTLAPFRYNARSEVTGITLQPG